MIGKLLKSFMLMFMIFTISSTTTFANEIEFNEMNSKDFLELSNGKEEITLNQNITLTDSLRIDKNYIINLNGKTLKFTKDTNLFVNDSNVTFKNGTINLDGIKGKADCILGVGHYGSSANLTLDNVNLQASNYTSPYALIYVYNESVLNIENNSIINAKNEKSLSGGVIKTNKGKNGKINITDSTLNFANTARGFLDGTINIKNSAVEMKGLSNGINSSFGGLDLTVDNSELTITGSIGRALTIDGSDVKVKNNSVLDFSNSMSSDIRFNSEGKIEVDKSSELNFKTVKLNESVVADGLKLNDLIVSEGYDYDLDDKGNLIVECKHSNGFIIINEKEATCTEKGYTGDKVCNDCNEVIETGAIILKVPHEFEDGICNHCGELDPNFKPIYPDVKPILSDIKGHWAEETIKSFVDKGFIDGYQDNTFKPDNSMTRAEFVKLVNKVFGFVQEGTEEFTDVNKDDWFYTDICIGIKEGYIKGRSKDIFAPNDNITREEVAMILTNIMKNKDENLDKLNSFKDGNETSQWAQSSVEGAIEAGYLNGYEDKTIKANSNITRAEAVSMLSRVKK